MIRPKIFLWIPTYSKPRHIINMTSITQSHHVIPPNSVNLAPRRNTNTKIDITNSTAVRTLAKVKIWQQPQTLFDRFILNFNNQKSKKKWRDNLLLLVCCKITYLSFYIIVWCVSKWIYRAAFSSFRNIF